MHPRDLRGSSLKYRPYSRSSRLVRERGLPTRSAPCRSRRTGRRNARSCRIPRRSRGACCWLTAATRASRTSRRSRRTAGHSCGSRATTTPGSARRGWTASQHGAPRDTAVAVSRHAGHAHGGPRDLRGSSLKYRPYSRSSRLVRERGFRRRATTEQTPREAPHSSSADFSSNPAREIRVRCHAGLSPRAATGSASPAFRFLRPRSRRCRHASDRPAACVPGRRLRAYPSPRRLQARAS